MKISPPKVYQGGGELLISEVYKFDTQPRQDKHEPQLSSDKALIKSSAIAQMAV